jgi:hypothetical protein
LARGTRQVGLTTVSASAKALLADRIDLPDHRNQRSLHHPARPAQTTRTTRTTGSAGTIVQLRRTSAARRISAGSPRTRRDLLPDPGPCTERLTRAIAEVLAGARPPGQLCGIATLDVLRLLARGAGRLGARPGVPAQRPIVESVHVSEPCEGVVEACAVINTGPRRRALALRLEGIDGQWRCTALHLG